MISVLYLRAQMFSAVTDCYDWLEWLNSVLTCAS